jgi:hypothetical protein
VRIDYRTAPGTADADSDYRTASGELTFARGATSATVSIEVNGDLVREPAETFQVELLNPRGALIGDGIGTCAIRDDDGGKRRSARH